MTDGARYAKIVAWSEEDQFFVGTCPDLMDGGGHGDDPQRDREAPSPASAGCDIDEG